MFMRKKSLIIIFAVLLMAGILTAQSLSQVGFIVKKGLPGTKNIAVLYPSIQEDKIKAEARTATLVTKSKFHVYGLNTRGDISRALQAIDGMDNAVVIIVSDNSVLSPKSVKYIAQKMGVKGIPVVSNRDGDTKLGALLTVLKKGEDIEIHLNKVTAKNVLKIEFSPEFLSGVIVDVDTRP